MSSTSIADSKHLSAVSHMLGTVLSLHGLTRLTFIYLDETVSVILILQKRKLRHGAPDCLPALFILA